MQQQKKSPKTLIIITIIVAIGTLAYFYFNGSSEDTSSLLTGEKPTSEVTDHTARILTLLNQTSSLKIDPELFKSAVYQSLVDHTVPVVEQPVGKANPFVTNTPAPAAASSR